MSLPSNISVPLVRSSKRGLAAAGLANQSKCLAGAQLETDIVNSMHAAYFVLEQHTGLDREVLLHVFCAQQQLAGRDIRAFLQHRYLGARIIRHGRSSISSGWIVGCLISFFWLGLRWQASRCPSPSRFSNSGRSSSHLLNLCPHLSAKAQPCGSRISDGG